MALLAVCYSRITKQCTGVAVRAESEINVAGGNPVIVVVMRAKILILRLDD